MKAGQKTSHFESEPIVELDRELDEWMLSYGAIFPQLRQSDFEMVGQPERCRN